MYKWLLKAWRLGELDKVNVYTTREKTKAQYENLRLRKRNSQQRKHRRKHDEERKAQSKSSWYYEIELKTSFNTSLARFINR